MPPKLTEEAAKITAKDTAKDTAKVDAEVKVKEDIEKNARARKTSKYSTLRYNDKECRRKTFTIPGL